jgi:hypothetical protein
MAECEDCHDGYRGPREVVDWNTFDRTVIRPGDFSVTLFEVPIGRVCDRLGRMKTLADTNLDAPTMVPGGKQLLVFRVDLFLGTKRLDILRCLDAMTIQFKAGDKLYTPLKVHDMPSLIFEEPVSEEVQKLLHKDGELAALAAQHRRYVMREHLHLRLHEKDYFDVTLHPPPELSEPVGVSLSLGGANKRPIA